MPFPLALCSNIEYNIKSLLLFSISHMVYLEAATERYSLNMCSFKFGKPDTLNKDTHTLQ